jgi:hypothetical protein
MRRHGPFTHSLDVLRPDDLLVLRFGFVNLRPDPDARDRLVRIDSAADAIVVITFQPQHVQDRPFEERQDDKGNLLYQEPVDPPPVVAVAARESRLAFRLPADLAELPLTLDALLDWRDWRPSLAANALPETPSPDQLAPRPRPAEPSITQTALELPYRLVLSPTDAGRWAHAPRPQDRDGRVELWHTRLSGPAGDDDASARPVRAVWTPDWDDAAQRGRPTSWPAGTPQPLDAAAADGGAAPQLRPAAEQRRSLVQVSGDFGLPVTTGFYPAGTAGARRLMLTALGGWLDVQGRWPVPDAVPVPPPGAPPGVAAGLDPNASVAMLEAALVEKIASQALPASPAGAPAQLFEPTAGLRAGIEINRLPFPERRDAGVVAWVHRARGGRDEYVEYQQPGLLWPLGHRASQITITERRFEPGPSGAVGGYLRQYTRIQVTQPVRDYRRCLAGFPHGGRELMVTGIRFTVLQTPKLTPPPPDLQPYVPMLGSTPYAFQMLGIDHEGRPVQISGPLLFVPFVIGKPLAESIARAWPVWNAPGTPHTAAVPGAPLAFAPLEPGDHAGLTTSVCHAIEWGVASSTADVVPADELPVLPSMHSATVALPVLGTLAGPAAASGTTTMSYPPQYLDHGFGPGNPSHLFGSTGSLPAAAAADRSGGVAAPSFTVQALSKAFGPVGDAAGIAAGSFDARQFLPTAKLFGALDLKDLIAAAVPWPDPAAVYPPALRDLTPDQLRARLDDPGVRLPVPVLAHREVVEGGRPVAVETLYAWKPDIQNLYAGILDLTLDRGAELALSVTGRAPVGAPGAATSRIDGRLDRFSLVFAKVIRVRFDRFAFTSTDGSRMDVHVDGVDVQFEGALSFVQTVREILPADGFADPPYLTVLPTGITAGYTLAVPGLGIGVVSIEQLALAAAVSLPFTGDPAGVRFAISSREHPFLVTVALFGGGGFFAVAVNTSGPPHVEAAIEFGGNFSLDIGVASGNVHVMAGIYFAMLGSAVKLSGYLRLGGSVCVLGIVSISVEFYLALTYDDGKAYGEASVTVSVEICGISKSVGLHVQKKFAGAAGDPTFGDLMDLPAWTEYADAFAAVPA